MSKVEGGGVRLTPFKSSCNSFSSRLLGLTLKLAGYFATHIEAKGGGSQRTEDV